MARTGVVGRGRCPLCAVSVPLLGVRCAQCVRLGPVVCPVCGSVGDEEGECGECERPSVTCFGEWDEDEDGPAPFGQHGVSVHFARSPAGATIWVGGYREECPFCWDERESGR